MYLSKTLLSALFTLPLTLTGCGGASDGGNDAASQRYQFGGTVQKGPLQPGAVITTINELNNEFTATGVIYTTQIEDYEGHYSVNEKFNTPYAELEAQGYYFNELTGKSDEQVSMSAFVDMNATTQVNFNVATSAMKRHTKPLLIY